ncbi:hypothetical protein [Streptomyces sp. NPDC051109]|uniref:hypothetical protein n=1 Tax=Streptomyces sp. NPDC051109 TaxID=3365642 RepID=UPI0037950D4F
MTKTISAARRAYRHGHKPHAAEVRSWERSIPTLTHALVEAGLGDVEMLLEHGLPVAEQRFSRRHFIEWTASFTRWAQLASDVHRLGAQTAFVEPADGGGGVAKAMSSWGNGPRSL